MTLNDELLAVTVDDSIQAIKSPSTDNITNTLLLYAKPLNLVIHMEEKGVIPWGIVTRTHQEALWST